MMSACQFHKYIHKLRESHPDEPVEYDIEEIASHEGVLQQYATINVDGKYLDCIQIAPVVVIDADDSIENPRPVRRAS